MQIARRQITFGPCHHFFGYIGHCQTIPWNASGRYIVCLESDFQDRMPAGGDAARILLLDTEEDFAPAVIAETRAWNPQQGCMLYWNPEAPERELFFNDRDRESGQVFTVLFDIEARRRLREYRFDDVAIANGGVAQAGGAFMAINYGRLGRLRPVTGYQGASDWTAGVGLPEDDGVFHVDVQSGRKRLVCSFRRIAECLIEEGVMSEGDDIQMFINHTLWNREGDRVLFYARSGWDVPGLRLNCTFTMRPDGCELEYHPGFIGGHPEWAPDSRIISEGDDGLRLYNVQSRRYDGCIGSRQIFSDPKGDKALSADARRLVHGNLIRRDDQQWHEYVVYDLSDGNLGRSELLPRGIFTHGDTRLDPAPCWDRDGNQVLVPAIDGDGCRNLFILQC